VNTDDLTMDDSQYQQQHQMLSELLGKAELQHYLDVLVHRLKVHSTTQLKYVKDEDLLELGMSKPEVQRLMKLYRMTQPGTFTKLRNVGSHNFQYFIYLTVLRSLLVLKLRWWTLICLPVANWKL